MNARVLVTGSRTWIDVDTIQNAMWEVHQRYGGDCTLIVGGARGADAIAEMYARSLRWEVEVFQANWEFYGPSAGPIRNRQMVNADPTICLAFIRDNSAGATNCLHLAYAAGVHCRVWRE